MDSFKRVHTITDGEFQRDAVDPGYCVNLTLEQWTELIKTLSETSIDEDKIISLRIKEALPTLGQEALQKTYQNNNQHWTIWTRGTICHMLIWK
jgi:hypothetical protein